MYDSSSSMGVWVFDSQAFSLGGLVQVFIGRDERQRRKMMQHASAVCFENGSQLQRIVTAQGVALGEPQPRSRWFPWWQSLSAAR